jgi:hypothetical protein
VVCTILVNHKAPYLQRLETYPAGGLGLPGNLTEFQDHPSKLGGDPDELLNKIPSAT